MRSILNFFKGALLGAWILVAIFTTICLLSYNDYSVSQFGSTSLIIIDNDDLDPNFKTGQLVIVKKEKEDTYKDGDYIFFYSGNSMKIDFINLGQITDVEKTAGAETSYYIGDHKLSYSDVIGSANGAIAYNHAGTVLQILESRWGFMFFIILPTVFLIVYEIFNIVEEVKKNSRVDIKEQLRREIEEEMARERAKE